MGSFAIDDLTLKILNLAQQDNNILVQQLLSAEFNIQPVPGFAAWKQQLIGAINQLILTDFAGLVNILYRMDVSEARLRQTLAHEARTNAGELIADLMIERQLEKLKSRDMFTTQNEIPDDEKW